MVGVRRVGPPRSPHTLRVFIHGITRSIFPTSLYILDVIPPAVGRGGGAPRPARRSESSRRWHTGDGGGGGGSVLHHAQRPNITAHHALVAGGRRAPCLGNERGMHASISFQNLVRLGAAFIIWGSAP